MYDSDYSCKSTDLSSSGSGFVGFKVFLSGASRPNRSAMDGSRSGGWTIPSVSVPSLNASGRPQDSAWLQLDEEIVLVGDAAKAFLETNSLMAKKSQMAAYKIVAALGAISTAEELPTHYDATVWLALPLTEIRTRNEVAEQLQSLCQSDFKFRDTPQRIQLSLKFFPEGFGLYLQTVLNSSWNRWVSPLPSAA